MVYRRPFPGLGVRCPGINRVLYDFIPKPTGTVESSEITHSGTGRFTWLKMRTMSLYESEELSGEVSLENLFSGPEQITGTNPLNIDKLAFAVCRGGWPHTV